VIERTTRDWALLYASFGWRVFPVVPSGKRPIYKGWQRDATTDPDLIACSWRSEPAPNIGLICGEAFVAFDIEVDHLPALSASMHERGHLLPETPIARTGRGGIHILVSVFGEGGHALRLDGVHIGELKRRGGFIVACPSRTHGPYEWLRSPEAVTIGEAPEWLRGLVLDRPNMAGSPAVVIGPSRGEARLAALARAVRDASRGSRNSVLYWAMRRAIEDGVPAGVAGSVLSRMSALAGLDEREVEATVRSASKATG
jgi:hypothetical protein